MFAAIELARRVERVETNLSRAIGVTAQSARPEAFCREVAGGVAVYCAPSSPINKMIGVGFEGVPCDATLSETEREFAARGSPLVAEVSTLADPALGATLTRRGYVLEGFENVLGRRIRSEDGDRGPEPRIDIETTDDTAAWLHASVTGFLHPDEQGVPGEALPPREEFEAVLRDVAHAPGFMRYVARLDGELAGVASLRFDSGIALLCGATTLPTFRRRGVQTAFLRRRLADAFHRSCDLAVMTTQPGSKSAENGSRQGFDLLYSRARLVKTGIAVDPHA